MEDKALVTPEQQKKMLEKTPAKFVKIRPGPGGTQLSYVETGYCVHRLNEVFGYLWDFEILEQQVGKKQVWVKGKLTVHLTPELSISKSNFGGADIKFKYGTEEMIDVGNDLKAASADALKKCASMFGMFEDLYWKDHNLDAKTDTNTTEPFS